MRLSTTVKDYIKEVIAEKYPKKEMPENRNSECEKFSQEIREMARPLIKSIVENYKDKIGFYAYSGKEIVNSDEIVETISVSCGWNKRDKAYDEIKRYNDTVEAKRSKVFRDIVVKMELGGTKNDLDALLANLPD